MTTARRCNVAVIGAGAAGLVTAHELLRQGHTVKVFEQSNRVGGLWNYEEAVESDPLGQRPERRIHGSLYASLTTNLPRDLMAFDGYTFDSVGGGDDHWPRYPGHAHVAEYLQRFSDDCDITGRIRFEHEVVCVTPAGKGWRVFGEPFDAVAVCNGHFSEPIVPSLPGIEHFKGTALHSHNYRRPEPFAGKRVVVLGSSVSGADLARELASVASVHFSGRAFTQTIRGRDGIVRCPSMTSLDGADAVLTGGGRIRDVDAIVFCTGYHYRLPFLPPLAGGRIRNNRVRNVYRQLLDIDHPTLAFVGLGFRIVPFPFFQRQARWFARLLAGAFELPARAARRAALARELRRNRSTGIAERHFHRLESTQIEYLNELAGQCGDEPVPAWFGELWREHRANTLARPGDYHNMPLKAQGPTVVPPTPCRSPRKATDFLA
ncbi:MAG: NAD(P)-binding domain-containing protein [Gammaproteobacteria bacterium]|nr:NAD(P)-binding domain-containing protein [Gammaproteobacteria bacterium]